MHTRDKKTCIFLIALFSEKVYFFQKKCIFSEKLHFFSQKLHTNRAEKKL